MSNSLFSVVRQHILAQVEHDYRDLEYLAPPLDWYERVQLTAETFAARIVAVGPALLMDVESSLNSPETVRALWEKARNVLANPPQSLLVQMDRALAQESQLLSVITGETISKLVADFLCTAYPDLTQNNRSTYPDLYFSTYDYAALPKRGRGLATGPALRGKYPTSIPDGIEIKSNRGARIRVDSHHNHHGLHLALTFTQQGGKWQMLGLYLAYLSAQDYTRAARNTTATTEKFSFGHEPFISVITGRRS